MTPQFLVDLYIARANYQRKIEAVDLGPCMTEDAASVWNTHLRIQLYHEIFRNLVFNTN